MTQTLIAHSIIFEVCFRRGVTYEQLCSPKQTKRLGHARGEIATALKRRTSMTLREIAAMFGRQDHSTVICWMKTWAKHSGEYVKANPAAMFKEDVVRQMKDEEWDRLMGLVAQCERLDTIEAQLDAARTADDSAKLVDERVETIDAIRKLVKANRAEKAKVKG